LFKGKQNLDTRLLAQIFAQQVVFSHGRPPTCGGIPDSLPQTGRGPPLFIEVARFPTVRSSLSMAVEPYTGFFFLHVQPFIRTTGPGHCSTIAEDPPVVNQSNAPSIHTQPLRIARRVDSDQVAQPISS
jgi:hypothetical protein